jgi:hypothetical protein
MPLPNLLLATKEEQESARRLADAVNAHVMIVLATMQDRKGPPYLGISLKDGSSPDNVLYDSRADCARHLCTKDPYVFPVKIGPDSISLQEAWIILGYARQAKKAGVAFHQEEPVIPHRLELARPWIPRHVATAHRGWRANGSTIGGPPNGGGQGGSRR